MEQELDRQMTPLIGVLPGEGCGPELTGHALAMLEAASPPVPPEIEIGGMIGKQARRTTGAAVYQTNHGCAEDLVGTDRVNPAGQILGLAMLVRERFGWTEVATSVVDAVRATWRSGMVTADLAGPGLTVVSTQEWMRASLENLTEQLACGPA